MKNITLAVAIVALMGATIAGQTNQQLAQARKENARALTKYAWKSSACGFGCQIWFCVMTKI